MRTKFCLGSIPPCGSALASAAKSPAISSAALRASLVAMFALGMSGPAFAVCGAVSTPQKTGVHSTATRTGVVSATSTPSAGSIGTPSMSSCPSTTNATVTATVHHGSTAEVHTIAAHASSGTQHNAQTTSSEKNTARTTTSHASVTTKVAKPKT
jgi:hypothetical protein